MGKKLDDADKKQPLSSLPNEDGEDVEVRMSFMPPMARKGAAHFSLMAPDESLGTDSDDDESDSDSDSEDDDDDEDDEDDDDVDNKSGETSVSRKKSKSSKA